MKLLFLLLISVSSLAADVTIESRNGMTPLHSEGRPIVRYLSENSLTLTMSDLDVILNGNIYGTQNWATRVAQEDGWLKTDAVRFQYGAEIKYWITPYWSTYVRHIMPHDRHDNTVGDGWSDTSYRMDVGFSYKRRW